MESAPSRALLAAIERNRRRVWGLCYRMTGSRHEADDLSQDAIARAIEREADLVHRDGLDGWILRIATTVCLDHLRRRQRERRRNELVDPLEGDAPPFAEPRPDPEAAAILREDLRFAVVAALQWLRPRPRAALILHDVCGRSLSETAAALGTNPNATKAVLRRARLALEETRRRVDVDPIADGEVVARLERAIESRSPSAFAALLDEDVWGVVDGGLSVRGATKPVFGVRTLVRMWENVVRRTPEPVAPESRRLNGEPALALRLPESGNAIWGTLHLETRAGRIAALRVLRDPERLAWLLPGPLGVSAGAGCAVGGEDPA